MSLTRKSLKAMGLTDEQIESVIEMHTDTVSGLKEKLETAENNVVIIPLQTIIFAIMTHRIIY